MEWSNTRRALGIAPSPPSALKCWLLCNHCSTRITPCISTALCGIRSIFSPMVSSETHRIIAGWWFCTPLTTECWPRVAQLSNGVIGAQACDSEEFSWEPRGVSGERECAQVGAWRLQNSVFKTRASRDFRKSLCWEPIYFWYKSREMSNPHCTRPLATPAWEV